MEYIALDAHKRYSFASVEDLDGRRRIETRIDHGPGRIRQFLEGFEHGSPVAVETVGNWYWIVSEIEQAGMVPKLVHALRAKMMLASVNKTDKLDARGMNRLPRSGTLPTVWIPPGGKNRIHAALAKYGLSIDASYAFGTKGRQELAECLEKLPPHTRYATVRVLEQIDCANDQIEALEDRMKEVFEPSREIDLLKSLPGVGFTLAVVCFLLRNGSSRSRQWWKNSRWTTALRCEPLPQVGLHRSGKRPLDESSPLAWPPRHSRV